MSSNKHLFVRKVGLSLERISCLGPSFGKRNHESIATKMENVSHGSLSLIKAAFVNDRGHYALPV